MRSVAPLLFCAILTGCTVGSVDDEQPLEPSSADASSSDAAIDDAATADAPIATDSSSADSMAVDSAMSDTGAPTDSTPVDPIVELCKGVATAPFDPPGVCDASSGNTSTEIPSNNIYSTSWFGCYRKTDGTIYKDPYDNCEFACGNKGLCASTLTGPECESELKWFAADADRYGCGGRIRVTNCVNGKQVVLTTLDKGPNCKSVEKPIGAPVVDMSHPAMVYLFDGKEYGGSDKKRVVVEKVAATTPLGPVTK
jgi:hypothetical protein